MKSQTLAKLDLPDSPGVYFFLGKKGEIIYIGKATSLKDRTKSYFGKDLFYTRGPLITKMVEEAETVNYTVTDTVIEAIILEANLIKKHQPIYNTKEKDNKSYNYVCITKDDFPRVITVRGRILEQKGRSGYKAIYGPYPSGELLRSALKIIRKIFPFLDAKTLKKDRYEFYKQIHLAPNVELSQAKIKYNKTIKNIELFFSGEKNKILKSLEKEMLSAAKKKEFELANGIKKQIFALNHINEVSLIKSDMFEGSQGSSDKPFSKVLGSVHQTIEKSFLASASAIRIEAYDIAHLSGSDMVGAFSVVQDGEKETGQYRTFNIKGFDKANDPGALGEVIKRRLNHPEWSMPNLIVADGNDVQKSVIEKELKLNNLNIPVVAVVKDSRHKARAIIGDVDIINKYKKQILLANAEVHRYVLGRHIAKRSRTFLKNKI